MKPIISCLALVTPREAAQYLDACDGDELAAAQALAEHRAALAGSDDPPDDAEVHHALYLLRRARGLGGESFDTVRFALRQRAA